MVSGPRIPAVQRLGSAILLQGPAVLDAHYLIAAGVRDVQRRDGIAPSPRLRFLLEELAAASADIRAMSPAGHGDVPEEGNGALSVLDLIPTREAAMILDLSVRQTRRHRDAAGGRDVGGALMFERGAVEALAARRNGAGR